MNVTVIGPAVFTPDGKQRLAEPSKGADALLRFRLVNTSIQPEEVEGHFLVMVRGCELDDKCVVFSRRLEAGKPTGDAIVMGECVLSEGTSRGSNILLSPEVAYEVDVPFTFGAKATAPTVEFSEGYDDLLPGPIGVEETDPLDDLDTPLAELGVTEKIEESVPQAPEPVARQSAPADEVAEDDGPKNGGKPAGRPRFVRRDMGRRGGRSVSADTEDE